MHAIIVTGGKQYKVAEGDTLFIEKLARGGRRDRDVRPGSGRHRRREGHLRHSRCGGRQGGGHRREERQGQEDQRLQVQAQEGLPQAYRATVSPTPR